MKKLLLIGTILIAAGCTPRRDEVCCKSHTLSTCEPAVYFEYDSAKIDMNKTTNQINLDWVAKKLQDWPDRTVILTGHTDLKGREEYNAALSGRRAKSIQEQLILRGVDPNKIKIEARGMIDPLTEDADKQDLNRRVDITFAHKGRTFFQACKDVWHDLFVEEEDVEVKQDTPAPVEEVKTEVKVEEVKAEAKIEEVKVEVKQDVAEIKTEVKNDVKEIKEDTQKDVNNIKEDAPKDVNSVQP